MHDRWERVLDAVLRPAWENRAGTVRERPREMTDFSLCLREQQLHRYIAEHHAIRFALALDIGRYERWQRRLAREIARRGLAPLP